MKYLKRYKLFETNENVIEVPVIEITNIKHNDLLDETEDVEVGDKVFASYFQDGTFFFEVVGDEPEGGFDKSILYDDDESLPAYLFEIGNSDEISYYSIGAAYYVVKLSTIAPYLTQEILETISPLLSDEEIEKLEKQIKTNDFNL